jgi:hypothetical protein
VTEPRRWARRPSFALAAILVTVAAVLTSSGVANAHALSASVFAQRPICQPRCGDATSVTFRTSVRLDTCVRTPGRGGCGARMRAFVWAEAELLGAWEPITTEKVNVRRVVVGRRVNVAITVPCTSGDRLRVRTASRTRVIGPHSLVTNTPNPNVSRPISVDC